MMTIWILCLWSGLGITNGQKPSRSQALWNQRGAQRRRSVNSPVRQDAIKRLRQRARLKESWDPFVQTVSEESPAFVIGGTTVLPDDLVPMKDLFSPHAIGMVDGTEEPPETIVYRSVTHPSIYAALDDNHSLLRAFRLLPDGNLLDLVRIDNTSFAEIDTFHDMDPLEQEEVDDGAVDPPYTGRGVFAGHNNFLRRRMSTQRVGPGCATVAKASIFLAADSDFARDAELECDTCSFSNRAGAAMAALQIVFAGVKEMFLNQACIDLSIAGYDIRTESSQDVYRQMRLSATGAFCSNQDNTLEKELQQYVSNDPFPGVNFAVFHLAYAGPTSYIPQAIGCAYRGAICTEWRVGVSDLGIRGQYSYDLLLKVNLLAHELGHSFGATHQKRSGYLMYYTISDGETPLASETVSRMQQCVNGDICNNQCLVLGPLESPSPTARPTHQATTNEPSLSPTTSEPSQAPSTFEPSLSPTLTVSSVPSSSPTTSPSTIAPTTSGPTLLPSTLQPTSNSPVSNPSLSPTTVIPTTAPSEQQTESSSMPSIRPSQMPSTLSPTTGLPTTLFPSLEQSTPPSQVVTGSPTRFTFEPTVASSVEPTQQPKDIFISTTSQEPSSSPVDAASLTPTTMSLQSSFPSLEPSFGPSTASPSATQEPIPSNDTAFVATASLDNFVVELSTDVTLHEIVVGIDGFLTEAMQSAYPDTFLNLDLEQVVGNRRQLSTLSLELAGAANFSSTEDADSVVRTQEAALQDMQALNDYLGFNSSVEEEPVVLDVIMMGAESPSFAPSLTSSWMSAVPSSTNRPSSAPSATPDTIMTNPPNSSSATVDSQLGLATQDQTPSPSTDEGSRVFVVVWVGLMAVIVIGSFLVGTLALWYHRGRGARDELVKLKKQMRSVSTTLTDSMSSFYRSSSFQTLYNSQGTRSSSSSSSDNDDGRRGASSLSDSFSLGSEDAQDNEEEPGLGLSIDSLFGTASDFTQVMDQRDYVNLVEEHIEVNAPPGMLGLLLSSDARDLPVVHGIQSSSPLVGSLVEVGDRLKAIDGVDIGEMPSAEAATLIASKKDQPVRNFLFVRLVPVVDGHGTIPNETNAQAESKGDMNAEIVY